MIDINSALLKAKNALTKNLETMYDDIYYFMDNNEIYLFFSGQNQEEYKDGHVITVNKKGGKVQIFSFYNYQLINNDLCYEKIESIKKINEKKDENQFLSFNEENLENKDSLEISMRDLIFNLVEKDIPLRTILKVDKAGITINNIKDLSLIDFAKIYGQAKEKVFNGLKELSDDKNLNLNDISIYALTKRGLSDKICKNLHDLGIDRIFKLSLIPEEIFATEFNYLEATAAKVYDALKQCKFKIVNDKKTEEFVKLIQEKPNYQKCIMSNIQTIISKYPVGIKLFNLKRLIDNRFSTCTLIDSLIQKMIEKKTIRLTELGLISNELKIKDYFDYLPDNLNNSLLKKYILEDETYESLGNMLGVSRQRIEQILNKHQFPKLYEDSYCELFMRFDINENEFCTLLDVEKCVYKYINYKYKRNKDALPIEKLFEEENLPIKIKNNLEKLYEDSYLFIDGIRILKTKKTLVSYYMQDNIHELTSITDIVQGFKKFIENYVTDYNKGSEKKDIEAVLSSDDIPVLSSIHSKFKYYDIYNNDIKNLIKELNLEQYKDVELSALYLYNLHKDLMNEYCIEDEYVLHNLLRKIYKKNNIKYLRTPYIVFGEGNRDKKLDELVYEMAPVKVSIFVKEYSKRYGSEEIFLTGLVEKKYKDIIVNGFITFENEKVLTDDEIKLVKSFTNEEKLIFKEDLNKKIRIININIDCIYSKNNMFKLGYISNSNYIYSNEYSSMTEYLEKNFFEKDIIDLNKIDKRLLYSSIFYEMLNDKRKELKFIEYENGKFMNIKILEKININILDLNDFIDKVSKYTLGKGIFTIKSIINQGFNHYLFDLGFDDIFYSSILRSNKELNYKRVKQNIIFENTNIKHEISISNILEELLLRYRKMEEYDLAEYLNDYYGLNYIENVWDLQKYIKDTNIYYDKYTDTYYYNYDIYFEEV